MALLVDGIGELVTNDPASGPGPVAVVHDAAVVVEDGRIAWVGPADRGPAADERLDVGGAAVLPGFVDSHSHVVFGGDRAAEFAARMAGESYAAGGIQRTVRSTRAATDEELVAGAERLAAEALAQGTTTLEVKSGYGLTAEHEARMLRVARRVTEETTYLGAHVVGPEFRSDDGRVDVDGYVELVTGAMLDACAPLARWVDVFVEDGAFDADAARTILRAGADAGLVPRVHANQLRPGPGVQVACELGAASADHCTHLTDTDVAMLADAGVVATLVPGADFSTRSPVWPDGRRLWDAGVTVAVACDCNPGTSYTTAMPFVVALAVRECGLTPSEAVWAATAGGAAALRRDDVGTVTVGARADLAVLDAPSHVHLAYRPGVPLVRTVLRAGEVVATRTGGPT
jgi:imidazolonepropionase